MKIIFSNLGYAKGISGTLPHHLGFAARHFYTRPRTQTAVLSQFKSIILREQPDICCLVEIDQGSFHSGYYNQMSALLDEQFNFHDISSKYGATSWLERMPFHKGKSNALLAQRKYDFKKLYFGYGSKRLIYQVELPDIGTLFFAHFSLNRKVRVLQLREMKQLVANCGGPAIVLADFNILTGFNELRELLDGSDLVVMNDPLVPTFTFHRRALTLDLCICSRVLTERARIQVIPQPFSDHAAILLELA